MKKAFLAWSLVFALCLSVPGCKSYIGNVHSDSSSIELTDALMKESDLTGDWRWHKTQENLPSSETRKEADQSVEVVSYGLTGFLGIDNDLVIIGHTIEQYEQQTPASLTITSADLLDIKDGGIYSPPIAQVGNSVIAKCAQDPDTRPHPAIACRIIVKYDHIASILAIYGPASLSQEIEKTTDQILQATDKRIRQVENTIHK